MIHSKIDASERVELRVGERATLVLSGDYRGFCFDKNFQDAHYLGFLPECKEFNGAWSDGWGHLFASLDTAGNISLYLAQSLKMNYWSDGCDDPSYAVGILAGNTRALSLTDLEKQFLLGRFNKWNGIC